MTVQNQYQYRGYSISDGRPVAIVNLAYDDPTGVYLNGSAIGVSAKSDNFESLGFIENVGYARRVTPGLSLDAGVSSYEYDQIFNAAGPEKYTEFYSGFFAHNISSHIYFSPNYFGRNSSTVYSEFEVFGQPIATLHLSAHIGFLDYVSKSVAGLTYPNQYDWRIAVARPFGAFELHAAMSGGGPSPDFYAQSFHDKTALVVGGAWTF